MLVERYAPGSHASFLPPPTIYRYFIKEDLAPYDLSRLKACAVAGEPLNPEIYNQFLKMTGLKLMVEIREKDQDGVS